MKLGLLADIHEEVRWLELALERFDRERVDKVVVLGDVYCTGERIGPTVDLLRSIDMVGVWGNHDFGLCHDPSPSVRSKFAAPVLDFMATLRPRLQIEGSLFTHVEPWLDPTDAIQLWYFEGPPDTPEKLANSFETQPQRLMFSGHLHRWLLATPTGFLDWNGSQPIVLAPPERYLIVVAAVCNGQCAVFDTNTNLLQPFDLRTSYPSTK
jgi:predicted phosphodiesterase